MQAYGPAFARVYNEKWVGFAQYVGPLIRAFYETTPLAQSNRSLLDVCCGTGQLAGHFLENGYQVTGVDLSAPMLFHARMNNALYLDRGQARFVQADAADFAVEGEYGLAVSTFDALNHLPGPDALRGCFQSVHAHLLEEGLFVFDLNTRAGLRRWNGINIRDMPDHLIIDRGSYDEEENRAWVRITGFVRAENGLYERFEQTAYNVGYDMEWVCELLFKTGWRSAYCARIDNLGMPLVDPEAEARAFFVARK